MAGGAAEFDHEFDQAAYWDAEKAASYDQPGSRENDPAYIATQVDLLAELAGPSGRAVAFAAGTGRLALPLAARGVTTFGVEISPDMAAVLRSRAGSEGVQLTVGDMRSTRVADGVDLVFLAFNSLSNVTSQDGQVACFENAAAHLRPGGLFLVELFVPVLRLLPPGERFRTFHHQAGAAHSFDEYDVVTQTLYSHHYRFAPGGTYRLSSAPYRYAWPAELDLMARIAGLRLVHRWGGWERQEFTADSESHVSVWEKVQYVESA